MQMKRTRRGFTLVELIVVIAILGILAGVAIPVYSSYIRKANQAADETLLGSVNTAFGAACMEHKIFNLKTANGAIETTGTEGHLKIATVTASPATAADEPAVIDLTESFMKYFKGNENSEFKVFTAFVYDTVNGGFKGVLPDGSTATMSVTYNGNTYTYTQAAVDTYSASSFNNADISELTGTVDMLSTALSAHKGGLAALVNNSSAFKNMLIELGVIGENEEVTSSSLTNEKAEQIANASVLYVAKSAEKLDADTLYNTLKGEGDIGSLLASEGFEAGVNTAFVNTAIKFAVATAFVNSEYGEDYKALYNEKASAVNNLSSAAELYSTFKDLEEFTDYIDEGPAKTDIAGFLAALDVINENAGNFEMSGNYADYNEVINSILHPGN